MQRKSLILLVCICPKKKNKKNKTKQNLRAKNWLESAETTEEYSIHFRHTVLAPAFRYTKEINFKRKQYENLQSGACTSLSLLPRCTPAHFLSIRVLYHRNHMKEEKNKALNCTSLSSACTGALTSDTQQLPVERNNHTCPSQTLSAATFLFCILASAEATPPGCDSRGKLAGCSWNQCVESW